MPEVVGTAYVRMRAITTKLASDIQDGLDKGAADSEVEDVGGDLGKRMGDSIADGLRDGLGDQVEDAIGGALSDSDNDRDSLNLGRELADSVVEGFEDAAGDGITNAISDALSDDSGGGRSETLGTTLGDAFTDGFLQSLSDGISNAVEKVFGKKGGDGGIIGQAASGVGSKLLLIGPILAGFLPAIVGAVGTIEFYIVGLIAQLGYLVVAAAGAGAALAGVFVGAIPAIGVIFAALKVATPRLAEFQENIKKIGERWKEVGEAAQNKLLPALESTATLLTNKLLPNTVKYADAIGNITGKAVKWAGIVLTTQRSQDAWNGILDKSRGIWSDLTGIIVSFLEAALPVADSLATLGAQLAGTFGKMAQHWKDMILASSDSGTLDETLQGWYDKAKTVFGGIADLIVGVWNVLKVGADAAGPSLDFFREFAKAFRWWTASPEGQNFLKKFFSDALEVMHLVNDILGDIIGWFLKPITEGDNSGIVNGLTYLKDELLPRLGTLFDTIFKQVDGDKLTKFLDSFTTLIQALADSGALGMTLTVIVLMMQALAAVLQSPIGPGVGHFIGLFLAIKAVTAIPGVGSILAAIGRGLGSIITSLLVGSEAGELGGLAGIIGGISASAAAVAAVVVAVVAAIAALYTISYFVFPGVRKVIDDVWESIQKLKDAFMGLFDGEGDIWDELKNFYINAMETSQKILTMPVASAAAAITDIAKWVGEKVSEIFSKLDIGEKLGSVVETVENKAGEIGGAILGFFTDLPGKVTDKLGEITDSISSWIGELPGKITGLLGSGQAAAGTAAGSLLSWIDDAIGQISYKLGYFLGRFIAWSILLPGRIWEAVINAKDALVSWITESVPKMISDFQAWWENFKTQVADFITNLPATIAGAKDAFLSWLSGLWDATKAKLEEWKTAVGNWIDEWILGLPEKLGALVDVFEEQFVAIRDKLWKAGEAAGTWLGDVADRFGEWVSDFVGGIPEKLGAIVEAFENLGRDMLSGLLDGLISAAKSVSGWMGDFFGGLFQGAKDEMESNSPSKKFMRLGQDMMRGLAIGIDKQADQVGESMDRALTEQVSNVITSPSWMPNLTDSGAFEKARLGIGATASSVSGGDQIFQFNVEVTPPVGMTQEQAQALGESIVDGAQKKMTRSDMAVKVAMA